MLSQSPKPAEDPPSAFVAVARTETPAEAARLAGNSEVEELLVKVDEIDAAEIGSQLPLLLKSVDDRLAAAGFLQAWRGSGSQWDDATVDALQSALVDDPARESVGDLAEAAAGLLNARKGTLQIANGDRGVAERSLAQASDQLEGSRPTPIRDYCLSTQLKLLSLCREFRRDPRGARDALFRVVQIEFDRRFVSRWEAAVEYGRLLRERGQYTDSLSVLTSQTLRSEAVAEGRPAQLARMQLATVRCTCEIGEGEQAFREVSAADETVEAMTDLPPLLQGRLLMGAGLVELQLGNDDESQDLLRAAATEFETGPTPDAYEFLDARLALAIAAFQRPHANTVYAEIAEVLTRPIAHSNSGDLAPRLRSHRIALEAQPFNSTTPPTTQRFRELLDEVEDVLPPVVRFRTLASLYQYAIGYLEHYDQARILLRLRQMGEHIDAESFPGLYQTLVTDRYRYAIEGRLSRYSRDD